LTGTGDEYIAITNANGGGYYSNYCDSGAGGEGTGFRFDPCTTPPSPLYIPMVEFNASASGAVLLLPGGPGQSIDFKITNGGSSPAHVSSVTFAITGGLSAGCASGWFTLTQPTTPVNVTIPANSSVSYQPSGASIALSDSGTNQNACENDTPQLTFTSS
jgi:hypothetical protein